MLTNIEKSKIAILRNYFTDGEWSSLRTSDDFARERIAFYASQETERAENDLSLLQQQAAIIASLIEKKTNTINILEG